MREHAAGVSVSNIKISIDNKSLLTRAHSCGVFRGRIYECKNTAEILSCPRNLGIYIHKDRARLCLWKTSDVSISASFRARDLIVLGQKAANRPQINGQKKKNRKKNVKSEI